MVFSIEAIGHSPAGVPKLDSSVERIALGQAQPFLHEIALVYGVGMTHLHTDIILHIGYRFASGNLPEGSVVHNEPASTYGLSAVPMSVGLRLTPFSFRVRPMLGLDLGGAVANVTYVRPDNAPQESGWSLIGEIRGRAGVHVDVWQWLSAQAFVEGRWTQDLVVEHGPNFDTSGIGFGLSIVGHTGGPEAESLFTPAARASARDESESKDGLLREYDPDIAKDSRLERAFELIRKADDLVKRKDYLGAEDSYRRGLELIPLDAQAQRNVSAPVHVDWAKTLIHLGRRDDARAALLKALEIAPDLEVARLLLERL